MSSRLNVLYVMGSGHSGSTLLDMMLGEIPGFLSCGEVHVLSRLQPSDACSCGQALSACEIWSNVVGADSAAAPLQALRTQQRSVRARHTPALLARRRHAPLQGPVGGYAEAITEVYRRLSAATGADVLIDSSKEPSHAALLGLLPQVNARFVHLVRDPRGVVYSYLRAQRRGADRADGMPGAGAVGPKALIAQGARWTVANGLAELVTVRFGRRTSLRLKYEDLISAPERVLPGLASLFGRNLGARRIVEDGHARLGTNHMLTGNRSRNRTGRVPLRIDDEWVKELAPRDVALVSSTTFPLLTRYGYAYRTTSLER